ncbi:MAG: sodium:proline symporter [Phycisphaerales bacterium]|nr:sodium:proline symporter [Phycisphaerales bacterium]
MDLHIIDWAILLIPLGLVVYIAFITQRHVKSVADFMTAGRAAGRYLVANAVGEASYGAISAIAIFEMWYVSGFAIGWWQQMSLPIGLFITLTGFVIYRYRESRVMTLAQFFEARYSKSFRIFMGIVAWVSGVLNYAVFPIVGARFFVYYMGFPQHTELFGLPVRTEALMMFVLLGGSLCFVLAGGQLTAMVTDCIEGLISGLMYIVVAAALLWLFSWKEIHDAMTNTAPGHSLMNPFDTSQVADFNIWYVLIGLFATIYGTRAWQGGHAFAASAANPHEAKMGGILGGWRNFAKSVMFALLAICAYTYMHHPHYSEGAAWVNNAVSQIDNKMVGNQMRVPLALSHLLPIGIKGMFASIMLFALISCDSSYMHSWGTIFAQDVVLPFRKKRMTPKGHIRLIRWSIAFVAVFAYVYGLTFPQTEYILMYFALTGTIFLGGAGSTILGGFYWKKGTTAGAFAGMITGSTLGVGGILIREFWPNHLAPWLLRMYPNSEFLHNNLKEFPINGQWFYFMAMVSAVVMYALVSLLTCREDFDLDRILHRGKWAVDEQGNPLPPVAKPPRSWKAILGIDHNFTFSDKCQSWALFIWTMFWFGIFVIFTIWNLIWPWPTEWWSKYWHIVGIWMPLVIGIGTTVWFTIGGLRDLMALFRQLSSAERDEMDDGTVDHNEESPLEVKALEGGPEADLKKPASDTDDFPVAGM